MSTSYRTGIAAGSTLPRGVTQRVAGSGRAVKTGGLLHRWVPLLGAAMLLVSAGSPAGQQPAAPDEATIVLADGPGHDLVTTRCAICHSVDYIQMNGPVMTNARWQATVRKMIDKYGAPISDEDAKSIIEYLSAHYTDAQYPQ